MLRARLSDRVSESKFTSPGGGLRKALLHCPPTSPALGPTDTREGLFVCKAVKLEPRAHTQNRFSTLDVNCLSGSEMSGGREEEEKEKKEEEEEVENVVPITHKDAFVLQLWSSFFLSFSLFKMVNVYLHFLTSPMYDLLFFASKTFYENQLSVLVGLVEPFVVTYTMFQSLFVLFCCFFV